VKLVLVSLWRSMTDDEIRFSYMAAQSGQTYVKKGDKVLLLLSNEMTESAQRDDADLNENKRNERTLLFWLARLYYGRVEGDA